MVTVSILGDLNGDFQCDCRDLYQMGIAFDSDPSVRRWNPNADLNDDGKITSQDLSIQASNYGNTYP